MFVDVVEDDPLHDLLECASAQLGPSLHLRYHITTTPPPYHSGECRTGRGVRKRQLRESDRRAPPYDFDEHVVGPLASSRLTLLLLLWADDQGGGRDGQVS